MGPGMERRNKYTVGKVLSLPHKKTEHNINSKWKKLGRYSLKNDVTIQRRERIHELTH